jgi:ABC-2 type transport system permease protein
LVKKIADTKSDSATCIFKIKHLSNIGEGQKLLLNREADLLLEIPGDFTNTMQIADSVRPTVHFYGDMNNPRYTVSAILVFTAVDEFVRNKTGAKNALNMVETFIGNSKNRTEFEMAVPGLIIFSVIMLLFSAGMIIIRDVEDKTLNRLKITKMTVFDYLTGLSITQVIVGIVSMVLTFLTAKAFGFRSEGSLAAATIIGSLCIISIIGITLIVVAFCKNSTAVLTFGNFPLFILMFFSGSMIPMSHNAMFTIGDRAVAWNDFLPPTHAVIALNKIFSMGCGISDVLYEIGALSFLSVLYFAIGMILFKKKHLAMSK